MLQAADTIGVFQVESRAQMSTLPRRRPERFYTHTTRWLGRRNSPRYPSKTKSGAMCTGCIQRSTKR